MSLSYSLCWDCQNSVCQCPWSKNFEPVPGWEATKRMIKQSPGIFTKSYFVKSCPLFQQDKFLDDAKKVSDEELGKLIGMSKRAVRRSKQDYLINRSLRRGLILIIQETKQFYIKPNMIEKNNIPF